MTTVLLITLLIIAAISNAIMDVLSYRYQTSIFVNFSKNWWNPSVSWKNKWKNGNPEQGERFWGSSRWFVRFTDAWHFFQGLMFTCFMVCIVIYKPVFSGLIDFALMYLIFTTTFQLFYSKIFMK